MARLDSEEAWVIAAAMTEAPYSSVDDAISRSARIAEAKARDRGVAARFVVCDALHLKSLDERFEVVLDCGLFHVFDDKDRQPASRAWLARCERCIAGAKSVASSAQWAAA